MSDDKYSRLFTKSCFSGFKMGLGAVCADNEKEMIAKVLKMTLFRRALNMQFLFIASKIEI
jgi:hypothetical protein